MDLGNFDVTTVELEDFSAIPKGKYKAIMINSEHRSNKSGNGSLIECEFEIIDGRFKGRKLKTWLNWEHPNEVAVKIGRESLARICKAVAPGKKVQTTEELHNLPMLITVNVKPDNNGNEQNSITYFAPCDGKTPTTIGEVAPWKSEKDSADLNF